MESEHRLNITNFLGGLLVGSAICLIMGGVLLYVTKLVPTFLLGLTAVAVIVIVPLSALVYRRNSIAVNISTVLGFVAPIISFSTPAHIAVLLSFGQDLLLSVLGLLQFLGFYLFPVTYVILRFAYWKKIAREIKPEGKSVIELDSENVLEHDDQTKQ